MTLLFEHVIMKFDCYNSTLIERHDFLINAVNNRIIAIQNRYQIYTYYVSKIWHISKMRMPTFQIFLSFSTLCLCTVIAEAQDENDYDETMEGRILFSCVCWSLKNNYNLIIESTIINLH